MEKFSLGERLRSERERLGIGQADAALLAGVSRNMWGAYERGLSVPNGDVLVRLLGQGVDVNWCLGGMRLINDERTLPDRERVLLERYRSMDEEGRLALDRAAAMEYARSEAGTRPAKPAPPRGDSQFSIKRSNIAQVAGRDLHVTGTTRLTVQEPPAPDPQPRPRKRRMPPT